MTRAPLADEVHAARTEAEEAAAARELLNRVQAAVESLSVVRGQSVLPDALPGDEVIATLAGSWPGLQGLLDITPAGIGRQHRANTRSLQLQTAAQALSPLAETVQQSAVAFRELIGRQRELLATEPWAELSAELAALQQRHHELAHELAPLQQLHQKLGPATRAVAQLSDTIEHQLKALLTKPTGAELVEGLASQLAVSCAQLLENCGLPIKPPPANQGLAAIQHGFDRVTRDLEGLRATTSGEHQALRQRLETLKSQVREITG